MTMDDTPVDVRVSRLTVSDRRFLVMFVLMMTAFVVLAFRTEVARNELRRTTAQANSQIQQLVYVQCVVRQGNVQHLNATAQGFIDIEQQNHVAEESVKQRRIALYQQSILPVPDCGPEPK